MRWCALFLATLTTIACGGASAPTAEAPRRTVLPTEYDDARVGTDHAGDVRAEMGLVEDPALQAYVDEVGRRLVRFAPRRSFTYHFAIVDQFEPNAFALPGGYTFVSRGLLALVNTEDELAGVLGHEIIHAAERHGAARQAAAERMSPFVFPYVSMAKLAAYGRDQERSADRGGQMIAALAGYDPKGLADFLGRLGDVERLRSGYSRMPSFFDTHPGAIERAADCAERARGLAWTRDRSIRDDHLTHIEGLELGSRSSEGVFDGSLFLHPDLDFQIRFPQGWQLMNTHKAVGARAPKGDALVFVSLESETGDPQQAAEAFLAKHAEPYRLKVLRSTPIQIGQAASWRLAAEGSLDGRALVGALTFVPHQGRLYRITAVALSATGRQYIGRARNVARSFAPLAEMAKQTIRRTRLHVVAAAPGEDLERLGARTKNAIDPQHTAVLNGLFIDVRFRGGERLKIARSEPYSG